MNPFRGVQRTASRIMPDRHIVLIPGFWLDGASWDEVACASEAGHPPRRRLSADTPAPGNRLRPHRPRGHRAVASDPDRRLIGRSNQIALSSGRRSTPQADASAATSVIPRPSSASRGVSQITGALVLRSVTHTRTAVSPSGRRITSKSVAACRTTFVASSLVSRRALSRTSAGPLTTLPTKDRAARTLAAVGGKDARNAKGCSRTLRA
jgi:hypothetical protein